MRGSDARSGMWKRLALAVATTLAAGGCQFPAQQGPAPAVDRGATGEEVADHPSKLRYPPLEFTPPDRNEHRHQLSNGPVVYVVEDRSLPLVDLNILMRTGSYMDPPGLEGLAAAVGSQLRAGGTARHGPDEFDEEVDFLAAEISVAIGETQGSASLNCLTKDLDRALELFFDMLRRPRFDESRLELYRDQLIQTLGRRNDSTDSIESREWERLMRGADHFSVDRVTEASVKAVSRENLLAFHGEHIHPGNFIVAVSGDVSEQAILAELEERFADWKSPESPRPPIPSPDREPPAGVYLVDKPDVNQGRAALGHLAVRRDHPDYHALQIMNHILGGGGFASRITSRVRSDEGLAYTARSSYDFGVYYDGTFRVFFQSKSPSVAQALHIVLEEIDRIRGEKASDKEVSDAINYWVGIFPRSFATARRVASTFARDELTGRDPEFWATYREKLRRVTADDVLRVARQHLAPERLVILVVGNVEDVLKGNPDAPDYSIEKIAGPRGGARRIPLPDPLSLEYPEGTP